MANIKETKDQIECLRDRLNELVSKKDILKDEEILKISTQLDELIYAFLLTNEE